jgi:hypothetical protein
MSENLAEEYAEAAPYIQEAVEEHREAWVLEHCYEQLYAFSWVMVRPEKEDSRFSTPRSTTRCR